MSKTREITEHIVAQYLPGTPPGELDPSLDLFDTGIITSLQLLHLLEWLRTRYGISLEDIEISPENFRSVRAIEEFVSRAEGDRKAA